MRKPSSRGGGETKKKMEKKQSTKSKKQQPRSKLQRSKQRSRRWVLGWGKQMYHILIISVVLESLGPRQTERIRDKTHRIVQYILLPQLLKVAPRAVCPRRWIQTLGTQKMTCRLTTRGKESLVPTGVGTLATASYGGGTELLLCLTLAARKTRCKDGFRSYGFSSELGALPSLRVLGRRRSHVRSVNARRDRIWK